MSFAMDIDHSSESIPTNHELSTTDTDKPTSNSKGSDEERTAKQFTRLGKHTSFISTSEQQLQHDRYNRGQLEYWQPHDVKRLFDDEQLEDMEEVPVTVEEPWSAATESTVRNWKAEAERNAKEHARSGYRLKFKYRLLNFILLAWAGIVLVVNGLIGCDEQRSYKAITLGVNAIQVFWTGLNSSMNLGTKYRIHFEYEAKYKAFALDIEFQLAREQDFRIPADAFMTEMRERKKHLDDAPEFPQSRYFFC